MNPVWTRIQRLLFQEPVPPEYEGQYYPLTLGEKSVPSVFRTPSCPCGPKPRFAIVGYCPLAICETYKEPMGADAWQVGERYETGTGEYTVAERYMALIPGLNQPPIDVIGGMKVSSVKHSVTAPFACEYEVAVRMAGPITNSLTLPPVTELGSRVGLLESGASEYVGRDEYLYHFDNDDTNYGETNMMKLSTFTFPNVDAVFAFDFSVRFAAEDGSGRRVGYGGRRVIRCHNVPAPTAWGNAYVLPENIDEDILTFYHMVNGNYGFKILPRYPRFGVYDHRYQAERILQDYGTMIRAYYQNCACNSGGWHSVLLGYDKISSEPENGYYELINFSHDPPRVPCVCCWSGEPPMEYEFSAGGKIVVFKTSQDGTVAAAPSSGYLLPCECLRAYATGPGPDNDNAHPGDIDPDYIFGGDATTVGEPKQSCPFCDNPDDPDAPENCIYSWDDWSAIPRNSEEYEALYGGEP